MKYILIIIPIVIIFFGCDPVDNKLSINNLSSKKKYYVLSPHKNLNKLYEPEAEELGIKITYLNYVKEITGNSKKQQFLTGGGKAWERYINLACEDQKIKLYTFDIDTLEKYSWKEIISKNYFSSKKEFSVDDLERINWEIKIIE